MLDVMHRLLSATEFPILGLPQPYLARRDLVLEIASGSGEHVLHFARASNPGLEFQPSDPDPVSRASIDAWTAALGLANVRPAIALDASAEAWPIGNTDAMLCINMNHIAPWAATVDLMRGAARVLAAQSGEDGHSFRLVEAMSADNLPAVIRRRVKIIGDCDAALR
jgi:Protein of unknown function (DUF938)